MKTLVQEGFFKAPDRKTREDVAIVLEARGILTKGKEDKIASVLARRVKRGILKTDQSPDGWVYWTE